ncbi:hypothetical protein DY000_02047361 [Brassica cretica]|uniref:Uncharacterized protein n=1 Tax=Brassica cretica TaxID=69181 RepID=A0ABQ7F7J0_BRACR|nr:hypothetical protein DY000_02047361 [Brassica cretica]
MAKKRISHGKEISDEIVEVEDVKAALSEKLFATDRCPCERVHMYLTIGNLLWVRNKLDGTPEMKLMGSWFGSLFKISVGERNRDFVAEYMVTLLPFVCVEADPECTPELGVCEEPPGVLVYVVWGCTRAYGVDGFSLGVHLDPALECTCGLYVCCTPRKSRITAPSSVKITGGVVSSVASSFVLGGQ